MMIPDVALLMERIYTINKTKVSGVNASEFYPRDITRAKLPLLVAVPGQVQRTATPHEGVLEVTKLIPIEAFVGNFQEGLPTESAVRNAYAVTTAVYTAYDQRPRLELDGGDPLRGVNYAYISSATGITADEMANALVVFTLTVNHKATITDL